MSIHDSLMRRSFAVVRLDVHKFNDLVQLNDTFSPSVYKRVIFLLPQCHPSALHGLVWPFPRDVVLLTVSCDFRPVHSSL